MVKQTVNGVTVTKPEADMPKASKLKQYFPLVREREELLREIKGNPKLREIYEEWNPENREEFLDFCTGVRGMKVLYDSFFKEVMNPEYAPERLEELLCVLLKRRVRIVRILPNDSTRIADEASLLITDIVVELEDGSLANVEIQKIGYAFPGPRSACYSADMLLRQYKRVRSRQGEDFSYNNIKNVWLIVIYEESPKEFRSFPDIWYHHSRQVFDSGLDLNLLQEYIMIPLDIFKRKMHNKPIETLLEAWLTFLSEEDPERIIGLIEKYPEFKAMYETLYLMCQNTERVMGMFSEELRELDRNTVKYMIEEQQREIDKQKEELNRKDEQLSQKDEQLIQKDKQLSRKDEQLNHQAEQIARLQKELDNLKKTRDD